jgi:hypothetical protein
VLKKIKGVFILIAFTIGSSNAQNIPSDGIVVNMEPVGMKIAQAFVTTEMLDAYKKQLVQRVVTAQPQYQGQETKIIAWLDTSFKMRDYLFYLGQSIGTKFTAEEENEIVAFLSTPVGKKFIKESNFISKESARVAAALVQKNLPTLADYIKNLEDNKTEDE